MNKKEMDLKLIDGVKLYPILWDCNIDLYKRNDLKPEAWTEVVKYVGPPATEEWAQKRWKNIRDTFNDNFRKVRESKRSGVSSDDIFKPTWHLYKPADFLIKTCKQSKSTSNLSEQVQEVVGSMIYDTSIKKWVYTPSDAPSGSSIEVDVLGNVPDSDGNTLSVEEDLNESHSSIVSVGPSSAPTSVFSAEVSADKSLRCRMPSTQRPSSCPPEQTGKKRGADDDDDDHHFFNKKGSSKRNSNTLLAQAVHAMEKIANEQAAPILPPCAPRANESVLDKFPILAFVGNRMDSMDEETRKRFENALMQLLMPY